MPTVCAPIELTLTDVFRFCQRFDVGPRRKCWPWKARMDQHGYGTITIDGGSRCASRIAWIIEHGRQPSGLVCHTCDNRACVNPVHLYDGDHDSNMGDMSRRKRTWNQKKTHCYRGHAYDEANTLFDKQGRRRCRQCTCIHQRECRKRKRIASVLTSTGVQVVGA